MPRTLHGAYFFLFRIAYYKKEYTHLIILVFQRKGMQESLLGAIEIIARLY